MKIKGLLAGSTSLVLAGCSQISTHSLENILSDNSSQDVVYVNMDSSNSSQDVEYVNMDSSNSSKTKDTYDRLKNPSLSYQMPATHYVANDLKRRDLSDIQIGVDTATRNVYVFDGEISYSSMIFRAPTILGNSGRNLEGTFHTSSFSGPGAVWVPEDKPHERHNNVFGNLWLPLQNNNIAVDEYQGGWAPLSYNLYAIHGTNHNEKYESRASFVNANSRGCSRLYKDAVPDFRKILELSSPSLENISYSARVKNPTGNVYALGHTIKVTFGENLIKK